MQTDQNQKIKVTTHSCQEYDVQNTRSVFDPDQLLYRCNKNPTNSAKTNSEIKVIEEHLPCSARDLLNKKLLYNWNDGDDIKSAPINLRSLKYHFKGRRLRHQADEKDYPVMSGVYCLTDERFFRTRDGNTLCQAYKIGKSKDVLGRIKILTGQETFIGEKGSTPYWWETPHYTELETAIHQHLKDKKAAPGQENGREWFLLSETDLQQLNDWIQTL